jgi:hypothetical protein
VKHPLQLRWARSYLLAIVFGIGFLSIIASTTVPQGGGIVIAASDPTPPTLNFGIGQPNNGPNVTVSAGGSDQTAKLIAKTGVLNLLATATDPDSGIQSLQIFADAAVTVCSGGSCSGGNHGLNGAPLFDSTVPKKNPGETTSASSILAQALDLTQFIPQGTPAPGTTRMTDIEMFAVAKNNLGGTTNTPAIHATWSE